MDDGQKFIEYASNAPGCLGELMVSLVDSAKAIQLGAKSNGMVLTDYEAFQTAASLLDVASR